jgi:hypothetical protein
MAVKAVTAANKETMRKFRRKKDAAHGRRRWSARVAITSSSAQLSTTCRSPFLA